MAIPKTRGTILSAAVVAPWSVASLKSIGARGGCGHKTGGPALSTKVRPRFVNVWSSENMAHSASSKNNIVFVQARRIISAAKIIITIVIIRKSATMLQEVCLLSSINLAFHLCLVKYVLFI